MDLQTTTRLLTSLLVLVCATHANAAARNPSPMTPAQAANRIEAARGKKTVVLLYSSSCPRSRTFVKHLDESLKSRSKKVEVIGVSTDEDPEALQDFLGRESLSFETIRLLPWASGELGAALKRVDVEIGSTFHLPMVAVLDEKGRSIGQGEGLWTNDLTVINEALKKHSQPSVIRVASRRPHKRKR